MYRPDLELQQLRFGHCQLLTSRTASGWPRSFGRSRSFGVFLGATHRPLSSPFLGLPYRILNINYKKELLRSLWVGLVGLKGAVGSLPAPSEVLTW